jgi:hypothetical protein
MNRESWNLQPDGGHYIAAKRREKDGEERRGEERRGDEG